MGDWELIVEPAEHEPLREMAELACFQCGDRLEVPYCFTCNFLVVGDERLMRQVNIDIDLRTLRALGA